MSTRLAADAAGGRAWSTARRGQEEDVLVAIWELDAGRRDERVEVVLLAAGPEQRVLLVARVADDLVAVVDRLGGGALRAARADAVTMALDRVPRSKVCGRCPSSGAYGSGPGLSADVAQGMIPVAQ